ncbi:MAG: MerR family transcriptional regulator [Gammaproteobacteria bacterium]
MFHIGAVARMTGLSPDIIRAWERRYGVIEPTRTSTRHRLYSREDIGRLALIKNLVDLGHRIGTVGSLSIEELQARLDTHERQAACQMGPKMRLLQRVAVLGDVLPARLERLRTTLDGFEWVLMLRHRMDFECQVQRVRPDLLILEYPTVHEETSQDVQSLLERSGAAKALVIYGFGSQRAVRRLDTKHITPLRAPVDIPELKHLILALNGDQDSHVIGQYKPMKEREEPSYLPARHYSDEALASIAVQATSVQCECPHHLVDLIRFLNAFETYSAQCKHREPRDASLHAFLNETTAQARHLLEVALTQIVEVENIPLP